MDYLYWTIAILFLLAGLVGFLMGTVARAGWAVIMVTIYVIAVVNA